jgi:hypothetical protein
MSKPLHRRTLLKGGTLALLLGSADIALGATIVAVRVWPAADYTRVTIESDTALKTTPLFVANPPRLAVDIDGIELNPALRELVGKVRSDDPYITGVRVGQYTPTTVRLVLDLRQMVQPQVFNLQPVNAGGARYQHRLVLDLYPTKVADPLEALIVDRLNGTHTHVPSMTATPSVSASTLGNPSDPLGDLLASQNRQPQPGAQTPPPAHRARQRRSHRQRRSRTTPTKAASASSSWRSTQDTAAKTQARLAHAAPKKKTWCYKLPTACASASTTPSSKPNTAICPCAPTSRATQTSLGPCKCVSIKHDAYRPICLSACTPMRF